MLVRISTIVFAGLVALAITPAAALAGGVIIDGRTLSAMAVDTQADDQDAQSAAPRGESTDNSWENQNNESAPAEPQADPADPQTDPDEPLTQTEQELYVFVAAVLGGHEANEAPDMYVEDSDEDSDTMASIIGDLDGDAAGGCAATPVSGLAAIIAMLLIRRRRRG